MNIHVSSGNSTYTSSSSSSSSSIAAPVAVAVADAATAKELGMNALDLGALHQLAEYRFASNEIGIEVGSFDGATPHSMKAPHVKLALKARVFGIVEVIGHDFGVKYFNPVDLEAVLRGDPRNDIVEALGVRIVQYAVEFQWKEKGNG